MDRRARDNAATSIRLMIGALIAAVVLAVGVAVRSEPVDPATDQHGDRRRAGAGAGRARPDRAGGIARRAGRAGERVQRDGPHAARVSPGRHGRLLRAQKTAQATIDSFPDPVVVVDPMGSVEQANRAARRLLGVSPAAESPVPWHPAEPLKTLISDVLAGRGDYLPVSLEQAISLSDGGQERYFLPRVLAIRTEADELLGAAVAMVDVTKFHLLDRLKSDMVSTVSHELKTPLTSVQMAIHLLLEELVGPLTPKQVELLLAARQDSDRILTMINDLLDLTRIEQGRVQLDLTRRARRPSSSRKPSSGFSPRRKPAGWSLTSEVHGDDLDRDGRSRADRARVRQPDHERDPAHRPRGDRSASARSPTASARGSWFATPARESPPSTSPASSRSSIAFRRPRHTGGAGPGPGDRPRDRHGPRRPDRGRQPARQRERPSPSPCRRAA